MSRVDLGPAIVMKTDLVLFRCKEIGACISYLVCVDYLVSSHVANMLKLGSAHA